MKWSKSFPGKWVLAAAAILIGLGGIHSASADPSLSIRIGPQGPPPEREDARWESPHRTAVWIAGHHEWKEGRYVWIGGYYSYPPTGRHRWVQGSYPHQEDGYYYRPGHWSN